MHGNSRKKVAVVVDLSTRAGNMKLSGIYRYQHGTMPWDLRLIPSTDTLTAERAEDMVSWADGLILLKLVSKDLVARIRERALPTVTVEFTLRELSVKANVRIDSRAVAESALAHFMSRGKFATYAFLSDAQNKSWSRYRVLDYERVLGERNLPLVRLANDRALAQRLNDLPKPVAVLAADDRTALSLARTCQSEGLAIPDAVAILGIDNDERFALASRPMLSSVEPDYEREGYEAAKMLEALMNRRRRKDWTVRCGVMTVYVRESSAIRAPSLTLVERAEDYIRQHYADISGPDDLARQLGVSRRLLDLRLRELRRPPAATLLRTIRLEQLKKALRNDTSPIDVIVRRMGFSNPNWTKTIFRKVYGMTMSDWRHGR